MTTVGQSALRKLLAVQARLEAGERDLALPLKESEARALLAALNSLEECSGGAADLRDQLAEMLKARMDQLQKLAHKHFYFKKREDYDAYVTQAEASGDSVATFREYIATCDMDEEYAAFCASIDPADLTEH